MILGVDARRLIVTIVEMQVAFVNICASKSVSNEAWVTLHSYNTIVFVQKPFTLQLSIPSTHSSIS